MLVVLDLLQGLDLPQSLVGDAVLQPPQGHFLQGHRLSGLMINTVITDRLQTVRGESASRTSAVSRTTLWDVV